MEIIRHSNLRPIRFYCGHCGCVFKEDYIKCGTGKDVRTKHYQIIGTCSHTWKKDYVTHYYTCTCPDCGRVVTRSEKDYLDQCKTEAEAERQLAWKQKEAEIQRRSEESRVEYALQETICRRKMKEEEDAEILFDWSLFVVKLAEQERLNEEKMRYWNLTKDDIRLIESEKKVSLENREEFIRIYGDLLRFRSEKIGVSVDFILDHLDLHAPPTIDHSLYNPFLETA